MPSFTNIVTASISFLAIVSALPTVNLNERQEVPTIQTNVDLDCPAGQQIIILRRSNRVGQDFHFTEANTNQQCSINFDFQPGSDDTDAVNIFFGPARKSFVEVGLRQGAPSNALFSQCEPDFTVAGPAILNSFTLTRCG